ncbi:MAG: class 1 fructose-bisphosphatase [Pirellulales bacterium]|nr:class 1 fructose-bisphosphatase [Pirellulales bacterium]MBX3434543.1 class 1 fructose-bisphosphatase [Pirellulales bacterium]
MTHHRAHLSQTFERHILEQQQDWHPEARGNFSWLLAGIVLACKIIGEEVRRLGLSTARGAAGETNVHGERQQGIDVFANEVLMECLGARGNVGLLASEENEEPVVVLEAPEKGNYIVVFDPLDGSSNLDVNVSVGTIFSVYKRATRNGGPIHDEVLQPGRDQIAAGYVLYGSSTMLVYTTGRGVHGFTLDPTIGTFVLTHPDMKMPDRGWTYSVNESYADGFPPYCRRFLHWLKSGEDDAAYRSRYIGSLVADFHRTLLTGGIFMYPPTSSFPEGKLRLAYEANPIALLAEQAGGLATDGHGRILDIEPTALHQRVPLFVGSRLEMQKLRAFVESPLKV